MSLKPRITVEDNYVDGLTCAICESPDLSVVHVNNYPDFVSCGNCASAFVVEDEGSWIMYGKVNADLPETREFAVRQWTWLDAVRQRAQDERESQEAEPTAEPEPALSVEPESIEPVVETDLKPEAEPSVPAAEEFLPEADLPSEPEIPEEPILAEATPPSPISDDLFPPEGETTQEFLDEITKLEEPFPPPVDTGEPAIEEEPSDLTDRFDDLIPDEPLADQQIAEEAEGPSFEALFPDAEEFTTAEDIPIHLDLAEDAAPVEDAPSDEVDEVPLSRLEQVTSPPVDMTTDSPIAEPTIEGHPSEEFISETEDLPVPDWLEKGPSEEVEEMISAPPFSETLPEESKVSDDQVIPPFIDDAAEPPPITTPEADLAASAEPSEFLDLAREGTAPPTPAEEEELVAPAPVIEEGEVVPSDSMEQIPGLEEVDEPIEEHLLPPWARKEGALQEEAVVEEISPEPMPIAPEVPGVTDVQVEEAAEIPPLTEEPKLPPGEPEEGFRYRVVVNGDKLTFPKNVCAHCLRMPVSLAAAVRGTLPDPDQPGMRKPLTFKLPLCRDCEKRAKASTDEERTAKIQAHIISGIIAAFLLVIALVAGLARFQPNAFEGIMVLLIVGVLGYGVPAIFLLNRASSYPPPYDAAYVFTTLRVADDAGDDSTAFEWRNQGYAELFRQVNRRNAEDTINRVDDLMMLIETEVEEVSVEASQEVTEQEIEEMLDEAIPSMKEDEEPEEETGAEALDSLEQAFKESQEPKDKSIDQPETPAQ